jgi:hypothetical protein
MREKIRKRLPAIVFGQRVLAGAIKRFQIEG